MPEESLSPQTYSVRSADTTNPSLADGTDNNTENSAVINNNLEQELLTLAAQIDAATYRFIKLLARFDEANAWQGEGIKSFSHWLNWKIGMNSVIAREKVRTARALADLPQVDEAFSKGEISYTKVRALTRVATAENEDYLLEIARHGTGAHMEHLVRSFRRCKHFDAANDALSDSELEQEPDSDPDPEPDNTLTCYDDEDGSVIIRAKLRAEDGALVRKALEVLVDDIRKESELKVDSTNVSAETNLSLADYDDTRANALVRLADHYLSHPPNGQATGQDERYQVFMHIRVDPDTSAIQDHHFLAPEVARRLACDAGLTTVLEGNDGELLSIGRKSRTIPRPIRHALRIRDRGCCQYPGCTAHRFTDAHHVKHWAQGGATRLDNLVTLCRFHHRELHKGTYRIQPANSGDTSCHHFTFINRFNKTIPYSPPLPTNPLPLPDAAPANCLWSGERMDYQMAIGRLYGLETKN
tara:strand:+ start:943 stop:2355 length:1413 start_codon:yes stop_codon:yes gene_type:complete